MLRTISNIPTNKTNYWPLKSFVVAYDEFVDDGIKSEIMKRIAPKP
jgi:hypothetical protein